MAPKENQPHYPCDGVTGSLPANGKVLFYSNSLQDEILWICPHSYRHLPQLHLQLCVDVHTEGKTN